MDQPVRVLLVIEDNSSEAELIQTTIQRLDTAKNVRVAPTGQAALEFCLDEKKDIQELPELILLDLHLPDIHGLEVLQQLKTSATCKLIPVVVFTATHDPKILQRCYELRVSSYIIKPDAADKYAEALELICKYWLDVNEPLSRARGV